MKNALTVPLLLALSVCADAAEERVVQLGDFAAGKGDWIFLPSRQPDAAKSTWSIAPLTTDHPGGKHAARVRAAFPERGGNVVLWKSFPPPLNIREIRFWVRTSGNVGGIILRLMDSTWQIHQQILPLQQTREWQQVRVHRFASPTHSSGKNDGKWYPPALGMGLVIDHVQLRAGTHAEVEFSGIEAVLRPPEGVIIKQTKLGNVFLAGKPVKFVLWSDKSVVSWEVSDFWGKTVAAEKAIKLTPGDNELAIPIQSPGHFTLSVTASDRGPHSAQTSFAVLPAGDVAKVRESPFGMQTHFGQTWDPRIIPLISAAGITCIRDELYWKNIELTKGTFTFPKAYDKYMEKLASHRIRPLIILDYTNRFYDDGHTPYSQDGLGGYTRYTEELLKHYGKRIGWVEVYNEYNIFFCTGPAASKPANYFAMLKSTYEAVKAARADVTVVGCATASIPLEWLRKVFASGGLKYLDVVSVHPYRQPHSPEGLGTRPSMDAEVRALTNMMRQHGGGAPKPIWVTEVGWPTHVGFSENKQAEYLVKCYAILLSAGVQKVFWFKFMDGMVQNDHFGLIRNPVSPLGLYVPKPSYVAYAVMARQLMGSRFVRAEHASKGSSGYLFRDPQGDTWVMWSAEPKTVLLKTDGALRVTDLMGRETRLQPVDGSALLPLTAAPVYVKGTVEAVRKLP